MIINDLDGYYIVFDTKNWNTELDTLQNNISSFQWYNFFIIDITEVGINKTAFFANCLIRLLNGIACQ